MISISCWCFRQSWAECRSSVNAWLRKQKGLVLNFPLIWGTLNRSLKSVSSYMEFNNNSCFVSLTEDQEMIYVKVAFSNEKLFKMGST